MPAYSRPGAAGSAVAVDPRAIRHGPHRALDDRQVFAIECREEVLIDAAQVRAGGPPEALQSGARQDGLRAAGVGQARVPLHQAVQHQPIDETGDAALAEDHAVGQLTHPDPPLRRVGDGQERVVFRERQVVLGAQLVVEPPRDTSVRLQEGAPGLDARITRGQLRLGLGARALGDGHGPDATPLQSRGPLVDDATLWGYSCTVNYNRGGHEPNLMTTWKIDKAHTQVNFSAKHMMVTSVRGTFHDVAGTIELDENDPTRSRAEFHVAAASVDTNFGARDAHLRSPDFFDAERFPYITFVSTDIRRVGDGEYTVTGDLTVRGVTKPLTFDVALEGIVPGISGARHAGLSATATVSRDDWGLNWNVALEQGGWLVGKTIRLDIAIAADEVAVAEAAERVGAAS